MFTWSDSSPCAQMIPLTAHLLTNCHYQLVLNTCVSEIASKVAVLQVVTTIPNKLPARSWNEWSILVLKKILLIIYFIFLTWICCALYCDNSWHRATIKEVFSKNKIEVCFFRTFVLYFLVGNELIKRIKKEYLNFISTRASTSSRCLLKILWTFNLLLVARVLC